MIPTFGLVTDFRVAAGVGDDREKRWPVLRERVVEVKKELDRGNRAGIARELAELVYEVYGTAIAHDVRLDAAIKEVHQARMTGLKGRPTTPNMWRAIRPLDESVVVS